MRKMRQTCFYAAIQCCLQKCCPENHEDSSNCFQGATFFVKAHQDFSKDFFKIPGYENQATYIFFIL